MTIVSVFLLVVMLIAVASGGAAYILSIRMKEDKQPPPLIVKWYKLAVLISAGAFLVGALVPFVVSLWPSLS